MDADIPYLLLTPGPLTTTRTVKQEMLQDYCTWDDDYNGIVTDIRRQLVELAGASTDELTSVLMQGSGTFAVESAIGSTIPPDGRVLVVDNGVYGKRISQIVARLGIDMHRIEQPETEIASLERFKKHCRTIRPSRISRWSTVRRLPVCSIRSKRSASLPRNMEKPTSLMRCPPSAAIR